MSTIFVRFRRTRIKKYILDILNNGIKNFFLIKRWFTKGIYIWMEEQHLTYLRNVDV